MQKLYSNILETMGNTPIVKLKSPENAFIKLEFFNPCGSIKGRVALNMINEGIKSGKIHKNTTIIEPTSGNTGVGLALCASAMGLNFIAIMPENMSEERKKLIRAYGAKVILTPKELGMKGSIDKAYEIAKELGENAFIPMQFENMDNPNTHYLTTGPEIYEQTNGEVQIVIASIGTGGTISGIGKYLKEKNPNIKIIGVEAAESPLLTKGVAGIHKIQGISANFIPKTLDMNYVDEIIDIKGDDAIMTSREFAKNEGVLVGISSGAVLCAMKQYKSKMTLGILPDNGERYLSGELYE